MGGGSWTSGDWDSFKTTATVDKAGRTKTIDDIFASKVREDFDPINIKVRESFDSADNPNSTPIIVALDVTGSMGRIPHELVTDGLGRMAAEIIDRKPVSDPHLMFMAVGDAYRDDAPLQATQFEADIRIAEQLKDLWIEGGGGGNGGESYSLAWYFASRMTDIDSFNKRGRKGVLFTVGDEPNHKKLEAGQLSRIFGHAATEDISSEDLLKAVEERYEVFHLCIKPNADLMKGWKKLMGERVLPVDDYTKVPEIIVSTLQVLDGKAADDVVKTWSGSTAVTVRDAIKGVVPAARGGLPAKGGVWRPSAP